MDLPMRGQKLHRAEESAALKPSPRTQNEQYGRGGRLRVRGWEEVGSQSLWPNDLEEQRLSEGLYHQQHRQRQQQYPLQTYPQYHIDSLSEEESNGRRIRFIDSNPFIHTNSNQHNISTIPSYSNQTNSRYWEYDQTFQRDLPDVTLTRNRVLRAPHPLLHATENYEEHPILPTQQFSLNNISYSTVGHTPSESSLKTFTSTDHINRDQKLFVTASNAVSPMDDSHPNSLRIIPPNYEQNKDKKISNQEKINHTDILFDKKKKTGLDQVMDKKKNLFCIPVPAPQSSDNDDDKEDKSPLPQNLRGDPFRSAKVKTELCRHFGTEKGCPFGDKCNYAHGEHELKYTKLMDLERAGLVDIEIFRTHPCPIWIATGSCPFDQRCSGLHDPRFSSQYPSWLPHAETLVNCVGTGANVDKLYHQQLSAVYSCSPIYNYIPPKRWKSGTTETFLAWRHLYAFVCNLNENEMSWDYNDDPTIVVDSIGYPRRSSFLKDHHFYLKYELCRLLIVLKIRERRLAQCFAYLPTHLFCGELCMVLQTRVFHAGKVENDPDCFAYIDELEYDPKNHHVGSSDLIIAREIAFGPVGDPGIRPVSVWFNIEPDDLVPCTSQQAKRHKRSRHRLNKSDRRERSTSNVYYPSQGGKTLSQGSGSPKEETQQIPESGEHRPFFNYQPYDADAFNLVTNILIHRSRTLHFWVINPSQPERTSFVNSLKALEFQIQLSFDSQRRHWLTWTWSINKGRGQIDEDTDVPIVNGKYELSKDNDDNPCVVFFHGKDEKLKPNVLTEYSKLVTYKLWNSFKENMKWLRLHDENENTEESRSALPILRALSKGFTVNRNYRPSPHKLKEDTYERVKYKPGSIDALFDEWKTIQEHYDFGPANPPRSNRAGSDASLCGIARF